ncbi:MAG: hypothetical protein JW750_01575 [Anaerolineaceae bacterium]|nr:hypothetical protein [Anaerolineaceae bacterium]
MAEKHPHPHQLSEDDFHYAPQLDLRAVYDRFASPVTSFDCGEKCAPHNPHGVPFCCDVCEAVPVAYHQEWDFMQTHTDLWHVYRGDECPSDPDDPAEVWESTPEHMTLLACKGAPHCQRDYRAFSCRQFPFFPYITADDRFIGLAYEWPFEESCWVISNLWSVTRQYRQEFIAFYDHIFNIWQLEYASYAIASENMREFFAERRWRIPILHRNGKDYLLSPGSERLRLADARDFRKFGVYEGSKA